MDKRYQHCSKPVKMYRWLRWKPYYTCKAVLKVVYYYIKTRGKGDEAWLIWRIHKGEADIRMRYFYTAEEVFDRVRERLDRN